MKTKLPLYLTLAFCCVFTLCNSVFAQGTAFTYQGQLSSGGEWANGTYDLTFKLWNASSGGSQIGSTLGASGQVISNGLFTVILDFGGVFNGSSYWLELAVRTNGAASYATLSPRQELTPTPYAITAENVDGLVAASQLTGTIPTADLSGTYGNALTLNNAGNVFDGNGSGLTGLNASQLTSGTVPQAVLPSNVAYLNALQTFTGTNTFAGNAGSFIINNNFSPINTSMFTGLGLQYYIPTGEGAIMSAYNDGYGFLSFYTKQGSGYPIVKQVQIDQFGNVDIDQQNYNNGVLNNGTTNGVGLTFGTGSGEGIASQRTAGTNQYSLEFYTAFKNRMTIQNNGFTGINTTNPLAQLHVVKGSATGNSDSYDGYPAIFADVTSGDGIYIYDTDSDGYALWAYATGTTGIGVDAYGTSYGVNASTSTGIGVSANGGSGTAVYAYSSGSALTIGGGAIHVSGATTNGSTTSVSTAAFIQVASAANIVGASSIIYNTLCNGDPNAILIVTPNYSPHGGVSGYWNHTPGVYYNGTYWSIFNEDGTTMPAGPSWNVLVIKN